MTRINLLSGFAVSALSLMTAMSSAGTAVWDGSHGTDWDDADNWVGNTKPVAGDHVEIPNVTNQPVFAGSGTSSVGTVILLAGATMQVTSASSFTADELELAASAGTTFRVDGASTFTIDGGASDYDLAIGAGATLDVLGASQLAFSISSNADTAIDGEIFLDDNGRLQVNQDVTLAGNGAVRMHGSTSGDYSEIRIQATKTLQSTLSGGIYTEEIALIFGQSDMSGNVGEFVNDSGVYVNDGGVLDVDAKIDGSDGEWNIESTGELRFSYASAALTGDVVNAGLIVFNANIATTGDYYCNNGDIDFDGTVFIYNYGGVGQVFLNADQTDCM